VRARSGPGSGSKVYYSVDGTVSPFAAADLTVRRCR
jgi:hypothetical protein